MKRVQIIVFFLISNIFLISNLFAQTDSTASKETILYTLAYNEISGDCKIPLIGFVNVANANHNGFQLGCVNVTQGNFSGLKLGFVDRTKGNMNGSQIGFLNFGSSNVEGLQLGFGNHSKQNVMGSQIGFFNQINNSLNGLQLGFVNEVEDNTRGAQIGFVNETYKNSQGLQLGFINETKGKASGWQVGFLNVADTLEKGVPIGFFSFIKKGGYRAIEMSSSELYPFNFSFKTGIPILYSFIQGSFNHNFKNQFAFGAGLGSLIHITGNFYFNPEATYHSSFRSDNPNATSLALNLKYSISHNLQLAAGVSVVQLNYPKDGYQEPFFKIQKFEIDNRNSLLVGARFAITYNFTELNK
ncbi:MAG: hypothetical protein SNJ55_06715 [Chloroherpetonaceae bacterium]